ncbi:MAG: hypothetical protein SGILL_001525 [Bacillariaceae sp.]
MISSLKSFFIAVAAAAILFMTTVNAEISSYVGVWKVTEVYDSSDRTTPRELPTTGGPFVFKFALNDKSPTDTLSVGVKIGNQMRTSILILDEEDSTASIKVGLLMSTQMMPPQDQFQFEMFLSKALPKMTTMSLDDAQQQMLLVGEARMVLQAVDTADL